MRRLVMVFLLLALPLQFCWAAAAGYCLHGAPSHDSRHFGHHEHRHDAAPAEVHAPSHASVHGEASSPVQADAKVPVFDADCASCHLAAPSLPAAALAAFGDLAEPGLTGPPLPAITSPDAPRHERPNWRAA